MKKTLAALAAVFSLPRIPQDPEYHLFADTRTILGIPNFFDVVSNLVFLAAGIWGLMPALSRRNEAAFREYSERWPYIAFFLGFILTSFGSAYYHLSPENKTLVWDRLAMAVVVGVAHQAVSDFVDDQIEQHERLPAKQNRAAIRHLDHIHCAFTFLHHQAHGIVNAEKGETGLGAGLPGSAPTELELRNNGGR